MTISINEMKSKKKRKKMKVLMYLRENRSFGIRLLKNVRGINDNIVKNIDNDREENRILVCFLNALVVYLLI